MSDEPLHGDFMFDLQEEAVAAKHHALQDVQGHLLYWCIGWLGVDETGNLRGERRKEGMDRNTVVTVGKSAARAIEK